MTSHSLRFAGLVLFLVGTSGGCGSGDDRSLPAEPSGLESLDPPIRAQYVELRSDLEDALARKDGSAAERAETFGALGRWYHAQRLYGGAATAYGSAVELAPNEPSWPYYLAHVKRLHNERESAVALFLKVLEIEPDSVPAMVWLAELEFENGESDSAGNRFSRALELKPDCVRALAGLAKFRSTEGDHEAAVELYRRALARQPDASTVRYALAIEYQRAGDRERAEIEMERVPPDNRDQKPASLDDPWMKQIELLQRGYSNEQMLGRKALNEGRPAVAAQHFRRAVEQRPDATVARTNLALALKRAGQLDAARREAMVAVELDPDSAQARFMLAEILLDSRQYLKAIPQLQAAIAADPNHEGARFNLAQLLRGTGRLEEALPHYEKARQLDRQMARASFGYAVTLLWLGRHQEALASVEEALQWIPENHDLVLLQSRLLAALPDHALRDGDRALELSLDLFERTQSLSAAETVAMAWAETNRFEEAVAWQKTAEVTAVGTGRQQIVNHVRQRLEIYRRGGPCREPWLRGEAICPLPSDRPAGS